LGFHFAPKYEAVRACFKVEYGERRILVDGLGSEKVDLAGEIGRRRKDPAFIAMRLYLSMGEASK
jgi:hypothetical protein